ncbi:MAG TPA: hypothetical protein VHK01_15940 [Lacipirellulaceae bacterium]|nr:hypothetical protein [Lacipirellulaceae bacterium]
MRKVYRNVAVLVVVAVLGTGAWCLYRTLDGIRDAYAVWWVADMVVEHMIANQGAWPRDWDELRDDYQTCVARSGQPWSFEELRSRVIVDWSVDPKRLAAIASRGTRPPFRVIWLANGRENYWERREPNQIIAEHLKSSG